MLDHDVVELPLAFGLTVRHDGHGGCFLHLLPTCEVNSIRLLQLRIVSGHLEVVKL